jgi:hypothetical protein
MSTIIRVEMASDLEEDTVEAMNADGAQVTQFTPAFNRAPAGTAALRVPAEAFESIWDELDALHRRTCG